MKITGVAALFSFWKKKPRKLRKDTIIHGLILMDGHQYDFSSRDISTEGALIHIETDVLPETGIPVELRMDEFEINGHGEVRWAEPIPKGGVLVGLQFTPDKGLAGVNRLLDKS
jgi:hypothetical protein